MDAQGISIPTDRLTDPAASLTSRLVNSLHLDRPYDPNLIQRICTVYCRVA